MIRAIPLCLALLLVHLAGTAPATAQTGRDGWTDLLVEVSAITRQEPPRKLVEQKAKLEKALDTTTEPEQRKPLEGRIGRLAKRIEIETGFVVTGWAAPVDRRGRRTDSTVSMVGFYVKGTAPNGRVLKNLEPGGFVKIPRRGVKDLFVSGGRRYRDAARAREADRPEWWHEPGRLPPVPEPGPEAAKHVRATIELERETDQGGRRLHRYRLKLEVVDLPAHVRSTRVLVHVNVRSTLGRGFGPFPVAATIDRTAEGDFRQHRSWEILTLDSVRIRTAETTVEPIGLQLYDR